MRPFNLVGVDGNAFSIMSYVQSAMRKAGYTNEERKDYQTMCMSGDYDNLLYISIQIIDECNKRLGLSQDNCLEV